MNKVLIIFLFIPFTFAAHAQNPAGTVEVDYIYSSLLENELGEDPNRRVSVYLPAGYEENTGRKYPVIYYLHGFTWSDSLQIAVDQFDKLLDKAIATGKIKPVIVVIPNHHTKYRGSFYTNSPLAGNWADFTAIDLVSYIDENYRTIPNRNARGIAGHSMGGHGSIKFGMLFPDVFSAVYALSPAGLGLVMDAGINSPGYRRAQEIQTKEELISGYDNFIANALVAAGRVYSPNLDNPPFFADLPYVLQGDSIVVDKEVLELWQQNLALEMVNEYADSLRKLTALKLDWGRNEENTHIPVTSKMFSLKLENLGIHHYAEEYIGTHTNKIWTDDGRALNNMLPFFDTYLRSE